MIFQQDASVAYITQKVEIASQFSLKYSTEPLVTFTSEGQTVTIGSDQLKTSLVQNDVIILPPFWYFPSEGVPVKTGSPSK